jgi:hypothetical protein
LARAPALQAGGHRFDSDILHPNGRPERTEFVQRNWPRLKTIAPQGIAGDPKPSGKVRSEGGEAVVYSSFNMKM